VNFDQEKQQSVVRVVEVDVFQFRFQNLNLNRINYQDYVNDNACENEVLSPNQENRIVVVVVVHVQMSDAMQDELESLLEMNNYSSYQSNLEENKT